MLPQDVGEDTRPVTEGELGPNLYLGPPLPRREFRPGHLQRKDLNGKDLMFFLTRSYQALVYSDGGD